MFSLAQPMGWDSLIVRLLLLAVFDCRDVFSQSYSGNHCILWDCFIVVLLVLSDLL
jgi:hypothetical protein